MNEQTDGSSTDRIVCGATRDTLVRWGIVAAAMIALSIWCYIDKSEYDPPQAWDLKHINEILGYSFNHFAPWVLLPVGAIIGAFALLSLRRKLIADANGIGYEGKSAIPWSAITPLTQAQQDELKKKQILRLRCDDGRMLKLDGYKLRDFKSLVAFVDAHLPTGEPANDDARK